MDSDTEEQNYSLDLSSSKESESSNEESNSYFETQELEYSTDLSNTSSEETSSGESLPDFWSLSTLNLFILLENTW